MGILAQIPALYRTGAMQRGRIGRYVGKAQQFNGGMLEWEQADRLPRAEYRLPIFTPDKRKEKWLDF